MGDWPVAHVPNAIDTDVWQPEDKLVARRQLGLPSDTPLLLFGAMGGSADPRKGFDLLLCALQLLRGQAQGLELVVFGQHAPKDPVDFGFPIHFTGPIVDDRGLKLLYSACDAMVIPSRLDNLPNTGVEAQACGVPVIAFDAGGLRDIVDHQENGYLAHPYDVQDLANGILWTLGMRLASSSLGSRKTVSQLGIASRQKAEQTYSYPLVAQRYVEVFRAALGS